MRRFDSLGNRPDCVLAYFIRLAGSLVSYLLPFRRSHPTGKKARRVRVRSGLEHADSRGQYRQRSYGHRVDGRAHFLQSLDCVGVGPDSDGTCPPASALATVVPPWTMMGSCANNFLTNSVALPLPHSVPSIANGTNLASIISFLPFHFGSSNSSQLFGVSLALTVLVL